MPIQNFAELGLSEPLMHALKSTNYQRPTPIQSKAIPLLLRGEDLLGIAQTGTGKTAAFTLPLLHNLEKEDRSVTARHTRALILAPTRELVVQIANSVKTYGRQIRLRHAVVIGGVGKVPQINSLRKGVDILIATPGRLIELIQDGHVDLSHANHFILDEADRMLDMGFIRDIRRIVNTLPKRRQTQLFSATMPKEIDLLAQDILCEPKRVEIGSQSVAVDRINQQVHHLVAAAKHGRLMQLLAEPEFKRVIVFTRTKRGADKVVKRLGGDGVNAEALHGNKSQGARQQTLKNFRNGNLRVLVATDIASRGIDVDNVTHVVNYELPNVPECYVHRIGRTARAGASGCAISFCDESERPHLASIERLIRMPLEVVGKKPSTDTPTSERRNFRGTKQRVPGKPKRRWSRRRARQRAA